MTPNFKKYNKYEQYDNDGYIISVEYTPKRKYIGKLGKIKWTYDERKDLWVEKYEDMKYHSPNMIRGRQCYNIGDPIE
tara:strand:- start:315 stop:548 length:234 start_codon:yes stop_codon:yes gene_type:complete